MQKRYENWLLATGILYQISLQWTKSNLGITTVNLPTHRIEYFQEKKEEICLNHMTKAQTPTEKSKKQRDNTKNATKNFDYTTITDRLRTVNWSNNSHPTGVVKPVYECSTFQLTATAV